MFSQILPPGRGLSTFHNVIMGDPWNDLGGVQIFCKTDDLGICNFLGGKKDLGFKYFGHNKAII